MIRRFTDGIFAIAGAAGLSQFPEFYRQYLQRLGGRLDQASVQQERIASAAHEHGLSTADYVGRLLANADPVVRSEAENVAAALADADRLKAAYHALSSASVFERPMALAQHFDDGIARATFDLFVPAVPIGAEGLTYAVIGMLVGLGLLAGSERTARATMRRVRGRRRAIPR